MLAPPLRIATHSRGATTVMFRARCLAHATGVALLCVCTLALLAMPGCYRRVIATHGLGTETVTTEEPYQESGEIDRWLFGDKPNERKP